VVGLQPLSSRYFTATIATVGLGFFFGALRAWLGTRAALWGTAFLAISAYAVYFSVFAVEHVHVLFFLPLNAFLLSRWLRTPTPARGILLGLGIAASAFTHVGLVLAYVTLLPACAVALVGGYAVRDRGAMADFPPLRTWGWCIVPGVSLLGAGIALNRTVYS